MINLRAETLKALRATPVVAAALTAGLGGEQARRRPAPGQWAAVEVVAHLADTDERALARVRRMLAEDAPELPGRARHHDGRAVRGRRRQRRRHHLARLARLTNP